MHRALSRGLGAAAAVALRAAARSTVCRLALRPARELPLRPTSCARSARALQWPRALSTASPAATTATNSASASSSAPAAGAGIAAGEAAKTLALTDACVRRLQALSSRRGEPVSLRISVEGGGCSGFRYQFTLDSAPARADDVVFEKEGVKVVTDPVSLPMLLGSTVDFSADMMRSAFTVLGNPNAEGGCGCGVSFNLKS